MNRRDFIKNTAATTASVVTIANGVTLTTYASANDKPVTNEKRWGMLIDTNKLTEADIDGMVVACKEEHGWGNEPNSNEDQKGNNHTINICLSKFIGINQHTPSFFIGD